MSAISPDTFSSEAAARLRDFLLEDYKLKVSYLTNHFSRMWTRFNFFITLETLVAAGFVAAARSDVELENPWQLALLGLLISLCWYVVGAQDRYLIEVYRSQIRFILLELARNGAFETVTPGEQERPGAVRLTSAPNASYPNGAPTDDEMLYPYTGGTRPMTEIGMSLLRWRGMGLNVTAWPALLPYLASLLWLAVLLLSWG